MYYRGTSTPQIILFKTSNMETNGYKTTFEKKNQRLYLRLDDSMIDKLKELDSTRAEAAKLLGRSGRVLGLAAVAHIHGQRAGMGPWYVLSP